MKDKIRTRDWDSLSAYLDGQLSPRQSARLESRLEKEIELRNALEELREARSVLRQTPRMHPPRSYMLTPEMAGQQKRYLRLTPVFGWTSAVAAILLVFVLAGDLLSAGGAIPISQNAVPQEMVYAPVPERSADEAQKSAAAEGETAPAPAEVAAPADAVDAAEVAEDGSLGTVEIAAEMPTELPPHDEVIDMVEMEGETEPDVEINPGVEVVVEEGEIVNGETGGGIMVAETGEITVSGVTEEGEFAETADYQPDTDTAVRGVEEQPVTPAAEDISPKIALTDPFQSGQETTVGEVSEAVTVEPAALDDPEETREGMAVSEPQTRDRSFEVLFSLESGLALLWVATGLGWWYLRRQSR